MFPIHYLRDMFNPANIFYNRHLMTWWKSILVMVVWTIVMTLPFYVSFTPVEDGEANQDFEELVAILPEETASQLQSADYNQGAFQTEETDVVIEDDQLPVVFIPSADNIESYLGENEKILLILPDQYVYQVSSNKRYTANLPMDLTDHLSSNEQFIERLRQNYQDEINTQSRQILIMTRQLTFFILGLGGMLLIASQLNKLQRSHFHDLFSYQYCFGMVATAMGVPAILAIIAGFIVTSVTVMLPILWIGTILMLYLSYRMTQFKRTSSI